MNRVDELLAEVKRIQEDCRHEFEVANRPVLKKSLVEKVFVGYAVGPIKTKTGLSDYNAVFGNFTLRCTECSKTFSTHISETCPRCFSRMSIGGACLGGGSREKYFGYRYSYYAVHIKNCTRCDFRVACDEWNQ